jgi:hypothetical protein
VRTTREQKAEEGSRETDAGRGDQLMPSVSKCHRIEANISSIECRTGAAAGRCSGSEGRRSHKGEGTIGRKSGSYHIDGEAFRTVRRKKSVQISKKGKGLAVRRARHLERQWVVIERREKPAEDLRMANKTGQNCISMQQVNFEN